MGKTVFKLHTHNRKIFFQFLFIFRFNKPKEDISPLGAGLKTKWELGSHNNLAQFGQCQNHSTLPDISCDLHIFYLIIPVMKVVAIAGYLVTNLAKTFTELLSLVSSKPWSRHNLKHVTTVCRVGNSLFGFCANFSFFDKKEPIALSLFLKE